MRFNPPLLHGTLERRRNRFVAEIRRRDGTLVLAHCTNTGSLKTCCTPGWKVAISRAANPDRKLKFTWELVHNGVCWIGINTLVPNRLAEEAVRANRIPELAGYDGLRREVRYGRNSRIDLLLEKTGQLCYVEIKNVTMLGDDGAACFPDAVTARGLKHLHELEAMVREGHRAVMLYIVQRADTAYFRPAGEIDPAYAEGLRKAASRGVEAIAYRADVSPDAITIGAPLPVKI